QDQAQYSQSTDRGCRRTYAGTHDRRSLRRNAMTPRVISTTSMADNHSRGAAVKSLPIRGMCENGSRSSNHCENPASEPIRYSAMKPTNTPQATGVNRGASPNNATVTAESSQTAGI